ncbi:MAG: L-rhamnose/proton symporter RhaT [Terriglobia bacterium]
MNNHFWFGMSVILISGAMNAGFALPMKHSRTWKWENLWLVFSVVGIFVVPWALALARVPGLLQVYAGVTPRGLFLPLVFGLLWGFAQVTFGISLRMVGVALTFAVVSGLASLSGSLVPMLAFHPEELFRPRGLMLLLSIPVLIVGLVFYAIAGRRREKEQAIPDMVSSPPQNSFATGLALCLFTGIFGSSYNLGFAFAGDVIRASLRHGAGSLTSTYAVWPLVLGAGFIPNLVYCVYLLVKNRTASLFTRGGWPREAALGVAMGLLWITSVLSYGIATTFVGADGTSIGYMMFVAGSILFANAFGLMSGEWKGSSRRTRTFLFAAVAFILAAVVVVNLGGLFG